MPKPTDSDQVEMDRFGHYYKDVRGLDCIDVYRVLQLFEVTDPCIQHAVKKLLVSGGRGSKSVKNDVLESIASLQRYLEMRKEDDSGAGVVKR